MALINRGVIDQMNDLDVIEMLYQIRLALEDVRAARRVPFAKMYLEKAEHIAIGYLRRCGFEPGMTPKDADDLKLRLIKENR